MRLQYSGLTGPVLNFANNVREAFDRLQSVKLASFADVTALPNATAWEGREVRVQDIDGSGTFGTAIANNGQWLDKDGGVLA